MLGNIDLGIAIAYIALILIVGIVAGIGGNKRSTGTAEGYFLAGKTLRWPAIGLALFATNISTVHLVSLAQSGFDTGLLNGNFEWMAAFTLILLALFCGFLKILPVFIFVLPGLFAYTLFKSGQLDLHSLGVDAAGNVNSKGIYTLMITQLLPSGLIGVLVAALLSGLMSQISGALNSISTMVSYDIFKQRKPEATDKQLIRIGKISAVIAMVFSLCLLPLLDKYESIFNGINDVIAHIAPPITCVFLLGVFWRKASAVSAKMTLWIGSSLGTGVFMINKIFPHSWIGQTPFMMMAFYLFLVCMLIQIILSYLYPVQHSTESELLYWKSPLEPLRGAAWKGMGNYRVLTGILLVIVTMLYVIFK
ncbi:hypothetical protein [Sphingobacterium sp. DR205]|uniref:sodium:solute symporter family transporter n=1 Tax=Sphingobacterium sp. DR205 TaxID=2713573 RepID=UPI0013E4E619|nr:hypothetical protein [Sphingobacterium sp. DR205]QIH33965.1 hypothetical protein G6053_14200 [Sphingobacterium sp. DR205]